MPTLPPAQQPRPRASSFSRHASYTIFVIAHQALAKITVRALNPPTPCFPICARPSPVLVRANWLGHSAIEAAITAQEPPRQHATSDPHPSPLKADHSSRIVAMTFQRQLENRAQRPSSEGLAPFGVGRALAEAGMFVKSPLAIGFATIFRPGGPAAAGWDLKPSCTGRPCPAPSRSPTQGPLRRTAPPHLARTLRAPDVP